MSAKWDKLNKEFDDVIDNMTDEQWHYWRNNQAKNQALRQAKMKLEMEIHLQKLYFQGLGGRIIYQNPASNLIQYAQVNDAVLNNVEVNNKELLKIESQIYSLAA
jgi:hypothetical protein